ncbi:MAG: hypothetical protein CMD87_00755 [Gammaproteobacteria bacterium]|nr:hypothetical protein [Gammaproteobacteria bacterium]
MSTDLLLYNKPARKLILKTSGLAALVLVVGCQKQVKPPVTEIPTPEKTHASVSEKQAATEVGIKLSLPEQIDWNRRSREIARTELSTFTREQATKTNETPIIEPPPTMPPKSSQDKIEAYTPIENTPVIQAIGATSKPLINEPPIAIITRDPIKTAAKLLSQNQPESAILTVNGVDPRTLSANERADILKIKASAYRLLNMKIAALRFDAERLRYIESESLVIATKDILEELEQLPERILLDLSVGTDLLAGMANALQLKKMRNLDSVSRWLRKHHNHPLLKANLPEYEFLTDAEPAKDFEISVLLPLSGDLANAGRAIRDGILYEYHRHRPDLGIALTIIDSESSTADTLSQMGRSSVTEFVIGPLQKERVTSFLQTQPDVPVLALNRVPTNKLVLKSPVYSLSLAVEDDAKSAVNQIAREMDLPRIVVFHYDSTLGTRTAEAVHDQIGIIGGSTAGIFVLDQKKPEIAITKAFGISDSNDRRRKLSKILGLQLEHTPRIRQDMSAVIVHTDPKRAQQIRPLLDFYYLEDTKVYLIGAYRSDISDIAEDLKNTNVIVTPWDLGTKAKDGLNSRQHAQGVFGSLVAIGVDAMRMAIKLGFGGSTSFHGETGYLTLGADSLIHRQLSNVRISENQKISVDLWKPLPSLLQSDLSHAE